MTDSGRSGLEELLTGVGDRYRLTAEIEEYRHGVVNDLNIAVVGFAVKLGARSKIIAMNTLASGALPFREAIDYLLRFKSSLHAIVSATTKPERASQNFRILVGSFASP